MISLSSSMSKMPEPTRMFLTEEIAAQLTCFICFKIQRNSTTIDECIHSFCKKCITKKITEEELKSCPICQTDFGVNPLEKLRPDHNLQSLAAKLFPSAKKNTKKPNVSEGETEETETEQGEEEEPARRKERSLSSFMNTPNVSCETLPTGRIRRRGKPVPKKFPCFVSSDNPVWKMEDRPESSTSPLLRKNARNKKQLKSLQSSKNQVSSKNAEEGKPRNVWDLNCLADAVDTTSNRKPRSKGIVFRTPQSTIPKEKPNFSKGKGKECVDISNYINIDDDDDDEEVEVYKPSPAPPVPVEPIKKPRGRPKKSVAPVAPPSEGVRVSAQAVVDANASERRLDSIWLSLVATYKQDTGPPLPQIPSSYLRIKNIHAPVSFLKKYLVRKLDLLSEDEVDIELRGLSLPDNMELWYVIDLWGQAVASSEIISTTVGNSAKDFVMVLSYSRKACIANVISFFSNSL